MSINPGDKAPDFTLVSKGPDGPELVTLSEQLGSSNVVLLFFPMAFTGVCTQEMCDLTGSLADYEGLGAKVLAVSGDNPFAQEAWAQKENIKITLLSDYEHEVAKSYGVAYEAFAPAINLTMGGVAKRSVFVIGKDGIVRHAEVLESPKDLPDFNAVKEALKSLG